MESGEVFEEVEHLELFDGDPVVDCAVAGAARKTVRTRAFMVLRERVWLR